MKYCICERIIWNAFKNNQMKSLVKRKRIESVVAIKCGNTETWKVRCAKCGLEQALNIERLRNRKDENIIEPKRYKLEKYK